MSATVRLEHLSREPSPPLRGDRSARYRARADRRRAAQAIEARAVSRVPGGQRTQRGRELWTNGPVRIVRKLEHGSLYRVVRFRSHRSARRMAETRTSRDGSSNALITVRGLESVEPVERPQRVQACSDVRRILAPACSASGRPTCRRVRRGFVGPCLATSHSGARDGRPAAPPTRSPGSASDLASRRVMHDAEDATLADRCLQLALR